MAMDQSDCLILCKYIIIQVNACPKFESTYITVDFNLLQMLGLMEKGLYLQTAESFIPCNILYVNN